MMVSARIFLAFAVLGLATSATAFKPTLCDDSIIAGTTMRDIVQIYAMKGQIVS